MQVRTFNDALVSEYVEQDGAERGVSADNRAILNDSPYYNVADLMSEASFPMDTTSDCGCGSKQKQKISPEYKALVVLIGIVGAFVLVSHMHLARMHR